MIKHYNTNLAIKSIIGISLAIILFIFGGLKIAYIDAIGEKYFNDSIKKASIAYATTRVVNASVSIIKESDVQFEVAGVGGSVAIGQVLDPIDDMTERLSDVLVMAITSLGVQKLIYEISISVVPSLLSCILILLSLLIWIEHKKIHYIQTLFLHVSILLLITRLFLPFSSLANEFLDKNFFEKQINDARSSLELGSNKFDNLTSIHFSQKSSFGFLGDSANFIQQKGTDFKEAIVYIVKNATNIIENLLKLTFLYIGLFIIQVLFLPLFFFWLMKKLANITFYK